MRLKATWSKWSAWREYQDRHVTSVHYRSHNRVLRTGNLIIGTLVEADKPRYGERRSNRFFMYAERGGSITGTTYGTTAFRTVRAFIRELYK